MFLLRGGSRRRSLESLVRRCVLEADVRGRTDDAINGRQKSHEPRHTVALPSRLIHILGEHKLGFRIAAHDHHDDAEAHEQRNVQYAREELE